MEVAEPVVRFQCGVAEVFVRGAVEIIGPALGRDLDDSATVASKLGTYIVRCDTELLHCILSQDESVDIILRDVRSDAVNKEQALAAERPANLIIAVSDRLGLSTRLKVPAAAVGHGAALSSAPRSYSGNKVEQVIHVSTIQGCLQYLLALVDP